MRTRSTLHGLPDGARAHPSFPQLEHEVLDFWAADGTFEASVDARARGRERRQRVRLLRRPAVRQRPAALRPPAHRLRQGRRAALPDHARPPRRAPLRLGHPRPARRVRGREAARASSTSPRSRRWASRSSTTPAATRCCATPTSGATTSPARPAGSTSTTTTRRSTWTTWNRVMWAFKTLWDKGLIYEGFRVLWYCWRCETPLSATETKMDDVYRDRQDPAVTVGAAAVGARAPMLDGAYALVWTTTPWTLPSNLAAAVQPGRRVRRGRAADTAQALPARRGPRGRVRPRAGRGARACCARFTGAELLGTRVHARRSTSSSAGRTRTRCWPPTTSRPRTAPGSCTSRRRSARRTRSSRTRRASRSSCPVDSRRRVRRAGAARTRACTCSTRTSRSSATSRSRAPFVPALLRHETYEHSYPHCWRCDNPLIQRAVNSWFVRSRSSATGWSS